MSKPEFREEDYPNCVKEKKHHEEWAHIAQFFEWLNESPRRYFLARYCTKGELKQMYSEEELENEVWGVDTPIPLGKPLLSLFHEYIGVDPHELEMERRRLLDLMREMNQRAQEGVRQNGGRN